MNGEKQETGARRKNRVITHCDSVVFLSRVSGLLNLAVRFNARKEWDQRQSRRASDAKQTFAISVRALKDTATFT
jgi:hypothetical protein